MISILMISAKLATLVLLEINAFEIKVITPKSMSMTSLKKIYHVTQIVL